jgi:hypothetical protein
MDEIDRRREAIDGTSMSLYSTPLAFTPVAMVTRYVHAST